jgi:hypothetical protein
MSRKLVDFWNKVNDLCANPMTALGACVFVFGWAAGSWFSRGRFDPGLTIGSYVENAIQLVILFVAASLAKQSCEHHADLGESHELIHEKLDRLTGD